MRTKCQFPDIARVAIDGVTAQRFVRTGRGALANDDEAVEAGREIAAKVHAVHLDVRVGKIDVVVTRHEHGDLVCLAWSDLMVCGLRGGAQGYCGNNKRQEQEEQEKRTTHLSSVIGFVRWMQYHPWRIHKETPIE